MVTRPPWDAPTAQGRGARPLPPAPQQHAQHGRGRSSPEQPSPLGATPAERRRRAAKRVSCLLDSRSGAETCTGAPSARHATCVGGPRPAIGRGPPGRRQTERAATAESALRAQHAHGPPAAPARTRLVYLAPMAARARSRAAALPPFTRPPRRRLFPKQIATIGGSNRAAPCQATRAGPGRDASGPRRRPRGSSQATDGERVGEPGVSSSPAASSRSSCCGLLLSPQWHMGCRSTGSTPVHKPCARRRQRA